MHLQNIIWNEILHLLGKPIPRTSTALSFVNPLIFQERRGQQSLFAGSVFEQMPTIWEHVNRNLRGSNEKSRPNLIIETLCLLYKGNAHKMPVGRRKRSKGAPRCCSRQSTNTPSAGRLSLPLLFFMRQTTLLQQQKKVNNITFTLLTSLGPRKKEKVLLPSIDATAFPKSIPCLTVFAYAGQIWGLNFTL